MFEKYLQEIGLSDKEASVYLALLQVDHAAVVALAEKTKIKRPTVYVTLESLAKKGLVSQTQVGKKTHYQAEPPERLETFVERRKVMLDEQSKRLKDIIPQIKSIQREGGERPVVKYFEGKEGILSSFEQLFREDSAGGTAYLVYPNALVNSVLSKEERSRYRDIRIKKGIRTKVVCGVDGDPMPSDNTGDRVSVDISRYPITCDITVYGDKVRISTLGEKFSGIFIESKDVAETLKSIINLIYDSLIKEKSPGS